MKKKDEKYEKEMGRRSMVTYLGVRPEGLCSTGDRTVTLEQDWSDRLEQEQFLYTLLIFPLPPTLLDLSLSSFLFFFCPAFDLLSMLKSQRVPSAG